MSDGAGTLPAPLGGDWVERYEAVRAGRFGDADEAARATLGRALSDPHPVVASAAAEAYVTLFPDDPTPAAFVAARLRAATDPEELHSLLGVALLFSDPDAIPPDTYGPFLDHPDRLVRAAALDAVRAARSAAPLPEALVDRVAARLQDPVAEIRTEAATLLAAPGLATGKVVAALAAALEDDDVMVRASVYDALANAGRAANGVMGVLVERLAREPVACRHYIYHTVSSIGLDDPAYLPALVAGLSSADLLTVAAAAEAVATLGGRAAPAIPALNAAFEAGAAVALETVNSPDTFIAAVRNRVRNAVAKMRDGTP